MSLQDVLDAAPAATVDDVIALMQAIDATLPDDDGVKWFNRLYLRVTLGVAAEVAGATFRDPQFLSTLDVVFANLYFSALAAAATDVDAAPAAWRPLLRARHRRDIARIQFALAGMNAHINRDLPDGIVQTFVTLGGDPITDTIREADFTSLNDLLERVEQEVKGEFSVGVVGVIDRLGGQADDALAMWSVRSARSAAWTNAQVLWQLGHVPLLRRRFFSRLDSLVGMTGRGLLLVRDPGLA